MVRRLRGAPELQPYYCGEELPGPSVTDDSECLEYAREAGLTAYHVCGSCQMGPQDNPAAVVDDPLRVHGLESLRIWAASIMPPVASAIRTAAGLTIAENAADVSPRRYHLHHSP